MILRSFRKILAVSLLLPSLHSSAQVTSAPLSLSQVESQIAGPEDFDVYLPEADANCVTYPVENFGLSPSNTPEQNAAVIADIANAISGKSGVILVFPANKVYTVKIKKGQPLFVFTNSNDLYVSGNGSRLIFQDGDEADSGNAYFKLTHCNRVVIKDLTIGCDWEYKPLAAVGQLTSYNEATLTGVYTIVSDASVREGYTFPYVKSFDWDAKMRTLDEYLPSFKSYKVISDKQIETVFRSPLTTEQKNSYVHFAIQPTAKHCAIILSGNDHVLIENVKFMGIPFMAVAGRDNEATGHLIIRNCSLVPPKPDTYWAALEGFDVKSSWYKFENNNIEYCYDDVMNFEAGKLGYFLGGSLDRDEGLTSNQIIADSLQYYYARNIILKGAEMELADENFKPVGWKSTIESFKFQLQYYPTDPAHRCLITFKDPFPASAQSNYILYTIQSTDGGYFIRNNTIRNCFHHAIWGGNANGLIENNTIEQCGYPAIMIQMASRWSKWFKGLYPNNVIIRSNKLLRTNMALRQPASLFVGGGYDTQYNGYFPVDYAVTTNVLIEGNTIENASQAALGAWSCKNLIIRGNTLINPSQYPLKSNSNGNGTLFVKKSENIFIINNTAQYNATSSQKGIVNENNTNIQLSGNTGF